MTVSADNPHGAGGRNPEKKPAGKDPLPRAPELVKCPHCGRFIPREVHDAVDVAKSVRTCPACGLPIKDEHLA